MTEYLKSWIGGGSGNAETAPHPDQKTTHTQELKDGSTAAIHTAPESSAGEHRSVEGLALGLKPKPFIREPQIGTTCI